jgi:hypothetical protein
MDPLKKLGWKNEKLFPPKILILWKEINLLKTMKSNKNAWFKSCITLEGNRVWKFSPA